MPKLPSGLHFALDTSPLQRVVDDAYAGASVHVLMTITEPHHMFEHIRILYFRPRTSEEMRLQTSRHSDVPPSELEAYPSGFNLLTIRHEYNRWSGDDQEAFIAFLNRPETDAYLNEAIDAVRFHQQALLDQPSSMPGLIATWWRHGCHPLQEPLNDPERS